MSISSADRALVLFSGGQDSATCLAWALSKFQAVETVGFRYGQRHAIEMDCRPAILTGLRTISRNWIGTLGDDRVVDLGLISKLSVTALTGDPSATRTDGLPATFVPGRNLLFITVAAIIAEQRGIKHLVGGMCETDYSGYPDCRDDTLKALQAAINLGLNSRLVVHTPLMWIDKMQTWLLARELGGPDLVNLILEASHTCYAGERQTRHGWGYGCGICDACRLRSRGWQQFSELGARDHHSNAAVSHLAD